MRNQLGLAFLACLTLWVGGGQRCLGVLANAWHIPDNAGDLGVNMRNPEFEMVANTTVTIYQGLQSTTTRATAWQTKQAARSTSKGLPKAHGAAWR